MSEVHHSPFGEHGSNPIGKGFSLRTEIIEADDPVRFSFAVRCVKARPDGSILTIYQRDYTAAWTESQARTNLRHLARWSRW